jgi:TRAP-type C4-dicarboxylate transport system substrate-binding protein
VADGQDTAFQIIESFKLYEVQKYLSLTSHSWSGSTMIANANAWNALPADVQTIFKRNADKYALLACNDIYISNESLADKLRRQGFIFNKADTATMRSRLGAYYAHWKSEIGATAWGLLESQVGKLG